MKKERIKVQKLTSDTFVVVLALISILSFIGIVSQTIFDFSLFEYIESLWILIIGFGLLYETNLHKIKSLRNGISAENFPHLTNLIVGLVALFAGIFSFPLIRITNPSFHAIKGIVSLIAIAVIVIETWIIKRHKK